MVDVARRVVGVGSVGTRCWVVAARGVASTGEVPDRIVLQVKEAPPSVLAPYVGPTATGHEGRRVVSGQRLTQAASDLFLGWCRGPSGHHYYVRQLWDVKGQGDLTRMDLGKLTQLRGPLRPGAGPGPRPHRRRRRLAGYLGAGGGVRPRDRRVRRERTRPPTSGITPPWSTPSRQVAATAKRAE